MNDGWTSKQVTTLIAAIVVIVLATVAIIKHFADDQNRLMEKDYNTSFILYNHGDYPGAELAMRKCIAFEPGYGDARGEYQLGRCLLQEGKMGEATQEFQTAAKDAKGYYGGGRGNTWIPPIPSIEHKAQAALAWIHQNPNWQPPAPGQTPTSSGPPLDFPAGSQ